MAGRVPKSRAEPRSRGEQQRDRILTEAIETASKEGLEALTIGKLSAARGMSKSGLFAHFGSKEKLQLATIEKAHQIFEQAVVQSVDESVRGIAGLWSLCDDWLKHLQDRAFPSGYFFTGACFEYGQRNGPVASRLREEAETWMESIQRFVQEARHRKELGNEPRTERMVFELNSILVGAYWAHLAGQWDAYPEARLAILGRMQNWATDKIPSGALRNLGTWKKYLKSRPSASFEESR